MTSTDIRVRLEAAIAEWRATGTHLLTKLNALGSLLLAYALAYPDALTALQAQLPEPLHAAFPAIAPALWFVLVQVAKAKAITAETAPRA